jgi:hypothetical protein
MILRELHTHRELIHRVFLSPRHPFFSAFQNNGAQSDQRG